MNVMDAIRTRRSVRAYDSRAIPDDVMERMKASLRLAPSACNFQPWRFVLVSDPALKKQVARAASGQDFIAQAPVIVIGCGFPDNAYKNMGGSGNSVEVDIAIALDHLTLAAAAEGLGTCWIGSFNEAETRRLIHAPASGKIVAMTPLGYPASPDLLHEVDEGRRKAADEVFVSDRMA